MLSKSLLVVQVAISLVLVTGAGLFLRTLGNLRAVDVGFDPANLVLFRVNPQLNGYDVNNKTALFVKTAFLFKPNVVVTSVPYLLGHAVRLGDLLHHDALLEDPVVPSEPVSTSELPVSPSELPVSPSELPVSPSEREGSALRQ